MAIYGNGILGITSGNQTWQWKIHENPVSMRVFMALGLGFVNGYSSWVYGINSWEWGSHIVIHGYKCKYIYIYNYYRCINLLINQPVVFIQACLPPDATSPGKPISSSAWDQDRILGSGGGSWISCKKPMSYPLAELAV